MPNPRWYDLGGRLADQREAQAEREARESARQEAMQFAKDKFAFEREQTLAGNKRADLMLAIQGVQGAYPEAAAGLAMHPESREAILADPSAGRREQFARKTQSGVESTLQMLGARPKTSLAAPRGTAPAQLADILSGQTARQDEGMAADLGQFTAKAKVGQGFSRTQQEDVQRHGLDVLGYTQQFQREENAKNRWARIQAAKLRQTGSNKVDPLVKIAFKAMVDAEVSDDKVDQLTTLLAISDPERAKKAMEVINGLKNKKTPEQRETAVDGLLKKFGSAGLRGGPAQPAQVSPEAASKAAAAVKKFREGRGQ